MANIQLLNNVDHKDVRVRTSRSAELGDSVWYALTFPHEFRNVQRHYPIFFTKNPENGQFQAVAMFGFEKGENLFLDESGWDAMYVPLSIVRQPFLVGFQHQQEEGGVNTQTVISIDMDSPRISKDEGEPLFLEHGGSSEYLEQMNSVLDLVNQGFQRNQAFVDMMLGMDLLESFVLDVELNDGSSHRLTGFYTINEDSLSRLTGDDLVILNNNGYLEAVYMVVASMSNIPELVERRNRKLES
jgi:hypothetical protein